MDGERRRKGMPGGGRFDRLTTLKALGFLLLTEGVWATLLGPLLAFESDGLIPPVAGSPQRWLALVVIAAGAALSFASYREILEVGGGTPLLRWPPHRLVTSGPYAVVRHPQAIGMLTVMVGTALLIDDRSVWFLPLLAAAYQLIGLIPAETRLLAERFGDAYRAYVERVPGWVPRLR